MVSPNREELMDMAVRSAKQGNKDSARVMFRQVLDRDSKNERAVMWLAKLANSPTERKQWLERALSINPDNTTAANALQKMADNKEEKANRTLITYGTYVIGALLVFITVFTAMWAFAPLG
ncbi:MAG: hypothetical protein AAF787_09690 [Chloroflexota bacterium]